MHGWYRWTTGLFIALAMPVAWAESGTVSITGSVVESTCNLEAAWIDQGGIESMPRRQVCDRSANDPGRTYSRIVRAIDASDAGKDCLLDYFFGYVESAARGRARVRVIVRTYD